MDYFFAQGHKNFSINYNHPRYEKHIIGDRRDGDNIDCLNRIFCEYCQMYYIWKNRKFNNNDILTFCHYRRQVNPKDVDVDMVRSGYTQAYYFQKYGINVNDNVKYNLVYNFMKWHRMPDFIYKELEEYMDTQTIIPSEKISGYMRLNPTLFHTRMIFSIRYDKFDELMRFLNGYLEFVARHHNVKSRRDWINFYKDEIITYYRGLNNEGLSNGAMFYQSKDKFFKIYRDDYGIFGDCNCWRIYAYIFEYLVSMFIHINNCFYKKVYGS